MTLPLPSFTHPLVRAVGLLMLLGTSLLIQAQSIRYVKPAATGAGNGSSWANASGNLQAMINTSAATDQVWVAAGTYKPTTTTDRTISFSMKTGVVIYGGFAGSETSLSQRPAVNLTTPSSTTLSGDIGTAGSKDDNSYHVIRNPLGLTTSAVLDGFVITGGRAKGVSDPHNSGGGIFNQGTYSDCNPLIRNCAFQDNTATYGGAIYNNGSNYGVSSPVLINCSFQGNSANYGGAMCSWGIDGTSSPVLINCFFQNNSAASVGGAMYNDGGAGTTNPTLANCVVFGNGRANTFYTNNNSRLTATYSLLEAGVSNFTDGGSNLTTAVSPFVSATDARLNACAPAINSGNNGANTTATDLAGNPRIFPSGGPGTPAVIDMGAYEYQAAPGQTPIVAIPSVSTAMVGVAFSQNFTASGGTSPYSYSVASGSLPTGLSLDNTGLVSGMPAQAGSFTLTVLGRDATGCSGMSAPYVLTVAPASPIRYVRAGGTGSGSSWADASGDLQSQINVTGAQQVWVAQGTYKPGGEANTDRNLSFAMKNRVAIYGGFPASGSPGSLTARNPDRFTSVLSGDIGAVGNNDDNSYHVVFNPEGLNASAVLDGVVITGGNANARDVNSAKSYGGGMYTAGGSPTLINCRFMNNSASVTGGGLHNRGSNPTLLNCSFLTNSANYGGGMGNDGGSPSLTNCSFLTNSAGFGGGMSNERSSPTLTNCSFAGNNAGEVGGGMYNNYSNFKLTNCSLLNNTTDFYGGGVYNSVSRVTLTNCVVFGNKGANTFYNSTYGGNYSSVTVTYSLLEAGVADFTDGDSNLTTTVSPFVSSTNARLNGCSPAINTGLNSANSTTTDLDGNPRLFGSRIDMGAYEYQAAPGVVTLTAPGVSTATVGVAFNQNFTASGGTGPYTYTMASGSLPTGLSLDNMGVLSGTPTQAGSFTLIVLGRDATGCSGEGAPYELTVSEAVVEPTGPFAITAVTTISCTPILPNRYSLSFTPRYSGLTGQPITFRVLNELLPTTQAAPYTLQLYTDNPRITLSAVQTSSPTEATYSYDWLEACRASESTNTAPRLVMAIPDQAATVGVGYSYVIPPGTFTDDQTPGSLRLSARGLPPGISLTGYTLWGVPSTTLGSPFSVTLTASDPGNLSVSISVGFVVAPVPAEQPQPTPPFAITGVSLLSCTPVANRININFSPRYAGLSGQPIAFRVENELVATNEPGPYSLTLYRDNPVITLKATQTGSVGEASFAYNWLAACASAGQDNTPPRVNSPVASQTATVGQAFNLNLANTFADQETPNQLSLVAGGLPAGLSLAGSTISGTASASGVSMVTIRATDPGSLSVSTSFTITVVPVGIEPPTPPVTASFSLRGVTTVSCEVVSAGQRRVSFTPRYSGLDGSPVSFSVVNEMLPTTQPGPYTLRLYTDNPTITLKAIQSGTPGEASFSYDWLAACNAGARMGALAERVLSVRVLGNPVQNGQVLVEVGGAEGGPLQFNLTDMRGQVMGSYQVESAGSLERHTFEVGRHPASLLLLRASTPTQSRTVNVLKAD